jgi:hypothetical protein
VLVYLFSEVVTRNSNASLAQRERNDNTRTCSAISLRYEDAEPLISAVDEEAPSTVKEGGICKRLRVYPCEFNHEHGRIMFLRNVG